MTIDSSELITPSHVNRAYYRMIYGRDVIANGSQCVTDSNLASVYASESLLGGRVYHIYILDIVITNWKLRINQNFQSMDTGFPLHGFTNIIDPKLKPCETCIEHPKARIASHLTCSLISTRTFYESCTCV